MAKIQLKSGEVGEISPKLRQFSITAGLVRENGAPDTSRRITATVSTNSPDRAGDIVEVSGIDLTNYLKNPVVLLQHRGDSPIAKCVEISKQGNQLIATAEFPPEGDDELADLTYRRIKNGIISAVSIGLNPKEGGWEFIDDSDPWGGIRYTSTDMLEFSFVALPMNPEALILRRTLDAEEIGRFRAFAKELNAQNPEAGSGAADDAKSSCTNDDDDALKGSAARLRRVAIERLRLTV